MKTATNNQAQEIAAAAAEVLRTALMDASEYANHGAVRALAKALRAVDPYAVNGAWRDVLGGDAD